MGFLLWSRLELSRKGLVVDNISFKCAICENEQKGFARAKFPDGQMALSCGNCGIAFVYPLPNREEITAYYSTYPQTLENSSEHGELLTSRHRPILEYLCHQFKNGTRLKFLDFGFGAGSLLKLIAQSGHSAYGADLSDQNCVQLERHAKRTGLTIETVNLNRRSLDELECQRFDVITLLQAIEHVPDPIGVLRDLTSRLAPGGVIYLECPNEDAWYLRVKNVLRKSFDRENFFGSLNPPQHLFGFTRKSLQLALIRANCHVLECADYAFGDGIHQVETLDWYPSIGQWAMRGSRWDLYSLGKLFIRTMDPLMVRRFGAGGGLFALARKVEPP